MRRKKCCRRETACWRSNIDGVLEGMLIGETLGVCRWKCTISWPSVPTRKWLWCGENVWRIRSWKCHILRNLENACDLMKIRGEHWRICSWKRLVLCAENQLGIRLWFGENMWRTLGNLLLEMSHVVHEKLASKTLAMWWKYVENTREFVAENVWFCARKIN